MKKYTRKHYNKKLIAFGLCLFMGIGITSTGFAAWVMSRDAEEEAGGGVNVAIIEDASVKITLWQLDKNGEIVEDEETGNRVALVAEQGQAYALGDDFTFDADAQDNSGRLRASADSVEDLKVTVKGTLDANDVPYDLTATLELPENIVNAINQGYLELKNSDTGEDYRAGAKVNVGTNGEFTIVLEFAWGEKFKNMNPCYYYDIDGTGKAISDTEMETQMATFHKIMTGVAEDNELMKETYTGTFKLTLSATPSVVEDPAQGTV